MKPLTLVLIAFHTVLAAGAGPDAIVRSPGGYTVAPIHVKGLAAYAGRALHVFYVSGREATLAVSGQTLKIRALIREPVRVEINGSGEAEIPQTLVPFGRFLSFNYVLFEVTAPEVTQVFLRNADGTFPTDPRVKEFEMEQLPERDFKTDRSGFVSVPRLIQLGLSTENDGGPYLQLDASRDF